MFYPTSGKEGKGKRCKLRPVAPVWKCTSVYGEGSHYLWSTYLGAAGCLADADTKCSPGEAVLSHHSSWGFSPVTPRAAHAECLLLEASSGWISAFRNLDTWMLCWLRAQSCLPILLPVLREWEHLGVPVKSEVRVAVFERKIARAYSSCLWHETTAKNTTYLCQWHKSMW